MSDPLLLSLSVLLIHPLSFLSLSFPYSQTEAAFRFTATSEALPGSLKVQPTSFRQREREGSGKNGRRGKEKKTSHVSNCSSCSSIATDSRNSPSGKLHSRRDWIRTPGALASKGEGRGGQSHMIQMAPTPSSRLDPNRTLSAATDLSEGTRPPGVE